MAENIKKEDLIFTDIGDNSNEAVLGTLEGPCADFIDPTRNGRHYSETLWQKVFSDPIVTEMIEAGGIPGELDHPTDREETDSSRIAILLREKPKKKDGQLWAKFDILNTPLGKIAHTLAKAGFKLGISSRGSGDVIQNYDGTEEVDESTYSFKCFDLVLLPAVKSARLNLVTEGLIDKFDYRKALRESLESATEEDKELMQETLDNLNIDLTESVKKVPGGYLHYQENNGSYDVYFESTWNSSYDWRRQNISKEELNNLLNDSTLNEDSIVEYGSQIDLSDKYRTNLSKRIFSSSYDELTDAEKGLIDIMTNYVNKNHGVLEGRKLLQFLDDFNKNNINDESLNIDKNSELDAVDNNEANMDEFQATLKENLELAKTITSLQEKLSVSYAKEAKLQEQVERNSSLVQKLTESKQQSKALNNRVCTLTEKLKDSSKVLSKNQDRIDKLTEAYANSNKERAALAKQLEEKTNEIVSLNEKLTSSSKVYSSRINFLKSKLESAEARCEDDSKEYADSNKLVEQYKEIANKAVNKYIESQARILGVSAQEIKNRLPESYSFTDIDNSCNSLREYKVNISKLPFSTTKELNESVRMKATSSKKESILPADGFRYDDSIDNDLMSLAGL